MAIALAKRHIGVLIAGASDEINFLGAPGERRGFFNCFGFGDAIECALFLVCLNMVFILWVCAHKRRLGITGSIKIFGAKK